MPAARNSRHLLCTENLNCTHLVLFEPAANSNRVAEKVNFGETIIIEAGQRQHMTEGLWISTSGPTLKSNTWNSFRA